MKNLSIWAKNNRVKALVITIILHVVLGYFYFYVGAFLFLQKIILPSTLIYASGILFLTAYLFYPIKYVQKGFYKRTFFKEKQWQLVAMISAIIFMVFIGNHSTQSAFSQQNSLQEYSAQTIALDIRKDAKVEKKKNRKLIRKAKRQLRKAKQLLRKRIRNNVRKMRKTEKGMTDFGKFLAIFFSILVAIGLGILVLAISCNLSCSGNEALAAIVLVGGFIFIIGGLIAIIRKIILAKSRATIEKEKKEKESLG